MNNTHQKKKEKKTERHIHSYENKFMNVIFFFIKIMMQ